MKKVNQKSKECSIVYTNCVEWAGPNIPSLGIETGDCLTEVVTLIAQKVVAVSAPLDLTNLSLQCIVDKLDKDEPSVRSLSNILQLLIDNDCYLKDLIDAIVESNEEAPLNLDLKCIAQYDSFGNLLPYNVQSVLQTLINKTCGFEGSLQTIGTQIDNLQDQIDILNVPPYQEPIISSCTFTNKPTSQALKLLADAYCAYQDIIGDTSEIQTAMGLFPAIHNVKFAATPGWTLNPTTLSELIGNMIIVQTADNARITNIENNCCRLDCDDIELGFGTSIENDNLVFLFNNLYGTNIPSAFTDCGSTFIIEDTEGNKIGGNLTITNNYVSDDIDMTQLEKGTMITITITTKFCSEDGQTCQKCLSMTKKFEGGCCVITNTGTDDLVIVYSTPLTTI